MFRLIRTIIFVIIAFAAGLLTERSQVASACTDAGGEVRDGLCRGAE
ncbi:hypothetical protein [Aliishimia ponticola]|nr:hypothetical protein [Aliishimia ponticola]